MDVTKEDFFHNFRQELLSTAESRDSFQLEIFLEVILEELVDLGFTDGFEICHFRASRGIRVDGYWFNDEGTLDLFIADFDARSELSSLTQTDVDAIFKRLTNFLDSCINKDLKRDLEVTSPAYGLARQIEDRISSIHKVNFFLLSERSLSDRIKNISDIDIAGLNVSRQIWDISRIYRLRNSRNHKEPLDIDFNEVFGQSIACLPAHLGSDTYQSYLMVMPAEVLANLYEKYGARLLEQNVRTFLQARGSVNKGIRSTILNDPSMFFAYNNGITATAQSVDIESGIDGLVVKHITDLQIVNGGQTTASLFHTKKKDKADLSKIFVQMKLSVVNGDQITTIVPKISEYANTQNKVNSADFFSNHPFHIRLEEFSRRLWAPVKKGEIRETRWFYERARGQYADAQSKLTPGEQRRFKAEYPKIQMFTKTDLAKFENVWDEHPKWVNMGAQKNFVHFAGRIEKEWDRCESDFNEYYFKRAIARAIVFRSTEKLVSKQSWYQGGYRANIVSYTIAVISRLSEIMNRKVDFMRIWNNQCLSSSFESGILLVAVFVNDHIMNPLPGFSNISEWCKKEACWAVIEKNIPHLMDTLPVEFFDNLMSVSDQKVDVRDARVAQKIDNGIEAQRKVVSMKTTVWNEIQKHLLSADELTPKEAKVLQLAMRIPSVIPDEKQSMILLELVARAELEGMKF